MGRGVTPRIEDSETSCYQAFAKIKAGAPTRSARFVHFDFGLA